MRTLCFSVVLGLGLALPLSASAQEGEPVTAQATFDTGAPPETDMNEDDPGPLVLGAELGAIFPQPFTELGTHVAVGIEAGYKLPFIEEKLEVMFAATFSPPGRTFTIDRVEGEYEGEVDQQMLFFSLGPRFRFLDTASEFNINLAAGGRLFLLQTFSNGQRNGEEFAEWREQSTQFGFFIALGGEYRLGPGAIFLDVDLGYSSLPHDITGDVNTGNIMATLGYRFFLL
jgi:hypothetical protein